jgi:hypothetical protein
MIMGIAALVFIPLLAVALANLIWSLGGTWPIRDRALLAKTVVGRQGVTGVPKPTALLVSIGALAAGIIALSLADHEAGGLWLTFLGALLGAGFIARGVLGYTDGWRARYPEEPFATLDRRNYSPLSLFIGAGFLLLVFMRLI